MGVHHFKDLTVSQRMDGKTRIMQVTYPDIVAVAQAVIWWLWWAVGAGVSVAIAFVVVVMMLSPALRSGRVIRG